MSEYSDHSVLYFYNLTAIVWFGYRNVLWFAVQYNFQTFWL